MPHDQLKHYRARRDFSITDEPRGDGPGRDAGVAQRQFVIQKHAASRLHYDFRLEIDGVLKSWAVPKGIPTAKGDKRLAVAVEDHPVAYGSFEGIIPTGNYGAGTVMLWDTGLFRCLNGNASTAWKEGKLEVFLAGRKLRGVWTLVRMRPRDPGSEKAWLLIKTAESMKPISARQDNKSVESGKTMEQLADAQAAIWQSNKKARSTAPRKSRASSSGLWRSGKRKTLRG